MEDQDNISDLPLPSEALQNFLNNSKPSQEPSVAEPSKSTLPPPSKELQDFSSKFENEQKYGSLGQQAIAGIEGAAQGIAGPLATGAELALGVPKEDIAARREVNPVMHGLGEVAGFVGSMATGVGEAAIVSKLGATAVERLGLKGAEKLIPKLGASAVQLGAESALISAGDETSKLMTSENPSDGLQTAAVNVGLSGLLGAGLGAGFATVSPLWKATVGNKMDKMIEDFKGRFNYHLENPDPVSAVTDELTNYYKSTVDAADEVYGAKGLKAQEINKLMPDLNPKILGQADEIVGSLDKSIADMQAKPHDYPENLVNKLKSKVDVLKEAVNPEINKLQDNIVKPPASGEIFNAVQDLKQQLQEWGRFNKNIAPLEQRDFIAKSKEIAFDLRNKLEDPEVWGKAAKRQQAINSAFKEYLPALKDFERKFTSAIGDERVIDPSKINTYMNQLGKPNAELKQEMLKNFLDKSEQYRNVIHSTHSNLGLESPLTPSSLALSKATLEELTTGAKLADYIVKKGMADVAGKGMGAAAGATIGHGVGSTGIGALIGEHALGPFFSSVLPAITKPIREMVANAASLKAVGEYGHSITKGEALLNKSMKNLFKGGVDILPAHASVSERDRNRLEKQLLDIQQNPNRMFLAGNELGHYMPGHAMALSETAANAVQFINGMRPVPVQHSPLDTPMEATPQQKQAYDNVLNIAEQPMIVMQKIKDGTLTPHDTAALKALYPALYGRMVQKMTEQMVDATSKGQSIPYKTRMSMSLFMGQALDSTMNPGAIRAAQPKPPMAQPQTAQQPASNPKRSTAGLNKIPKMYKTTNQEAESDRSSRD